MNLRNENLISTKVMYKTVIIAQKNIRLTSQYIL